MVCEFKFCNSCHFSFSKNCHLLIFFISAAVKQLQSLEVDHIEIDHCSEPVGRNLVSLFSHQLCVDDTLMHEFTMNNWGDAS